MCFDDTSLPPPPPEQGPVARSGPLTLTSADGNEFFAYEAYPEVAHRGNMIVLPDRRGLHPFYFAMAEAFAQAGFNAVTFDFFGRTAGAQPRKDGFDWAEAGLHVTPEQIAMDAKAVAAHLRTVSPQGPMFSVGFCMGGSFSWQLAATDIGLTGSIGMYGIPKMVEHLLDQLNAPLQIFVAGADHVAPVQAFEGLGHQLDALHKPYEMYVYDGAPHAYFDEHFDQWAEICRDTWKKMLAFTDRLSVA